MSRGYARPGWACETCPPRTRRRRGNCSGPLSEKLRGAVKGPDGIVRIPATTWLRGDAVGDVGGEWSNCPVAELNDVSWLVDAYAKHKGQILPIWETYELPTTLVVDAMTELQITENTVDRLEREAEDRRQAAKAKAGMR